MIDLCRRVATSPRFQHAILALIVANAVLVGVETDPGLMARHGPLFHALNALVQVVFVLEIAIRLLAFWPRLHRFFRDGWNLFDFAVVALSLLPAVGAFATVARLARLFRALRLVSALPELRLIVSTLVRSIRSMGHVLLLLALVLYVYAVLGVNLFRGVDPGRWGSLPRAGLTLFEMLTLEEWVDVQRASFAATPWAWLFYVSYVVIAVFVVVNLFIAIVINNLEAAKLEERAESDSEAGAIATRLGEIRERLSEIEAAPPPPGPGCVPARRLVASAASTARLGAGRSPEGAGRTRGWGCPWTPACGSTPMSIRSRC
jgi:voltage-gated sodium channel